MGSWRRRQNAGVLRLRLRMTAKDKQRQGQQQRKKRIPGGNDRKKGNGDGKSSCGGCA